MHTEDVRRGRPGWAPLPPDERRDGVLWSVLRRHGRLFFRNAEVGVVLALPDGRTHTVVDKVPAVTVTGPAGELMMYAHGRTSAAQVDITGDPDAVRAFRGTDLEQ